MSTTPLPTDGTSVAISPDAEEVAVGGADQCVNRESVCELSFGGNINASA